MPDYENEWGTVRVICCHMCGSRRLEKNNELKNKSVRWRYVGCVWRPIQTDEKNARIGAHQRRPSAVRASVNAANAGRRWAAPCWFPHQLFPFICVPHLFPYLYLIIECIDECVVSSAAAMRCTLLAGLGLFCLLIAVSIVVVLLSQGQSEQMIISSRTTHATTIAACVVPCWPL